MRTACAEFAGWRAQGDRTWHRAPHERVSRAARHRRIRRLRGGDHGEFGLERGSICLEITESVVVQDIETTSITLAGLKKAGVQVAIDDFGTGYSVLSHLKSLPVDVLKIDRSFVTDLGSNPDDLAIVRAIIALAEAFGLAARRRGRGNGSRRNHFATPRLSPGSGVPALPSAQWSGVGRVTGQGANLNAVFRNSQRLTARIACSRMASRSCRPEAVHMGRPGAQR